MKVTFISRNHNAIADWNNLFRYLFEDKLVGCKSARKSAFTSAKPCERGLLRTYITILEKIWAYRCPFRCSTKRPVSSFVPSNPPPGSGIRAFATCPFVLCISLLPPCYSASSLQMVRPSPVPPPLTLRSSTRLLSSTPRWRTGFDYLDIKLRMALYRRV